MKTAGQIAGKNIGTHTGSSLARQLSDTVKNYEEQLRQKALVDSRTARALRWSKAHVPYEVIAPFMTRENLAQLGQHKCACRTLFSLSSNRLRHEDRFVFWEDMLSAVEELPVEWRAKVCLDCLHCSENWTPRERNGKTPYYNARDYDKSTLAGYVVSSKWLVDAPLVRKWYCRLHKPGYEQLACIDQKRMVKYSLRENLLAYIEQDDLPGFGLTFAMCSQVSRWTLFQDVMQKGALRIFEWLVENRPELFSDVQPYHLMVYSVANLPPKSAIAFLECLEHRFPGTIARSDEFGNNLLWYSLHNKKKDDDSYPHAPGGRTVDKNPMGKLITYLCRSGCRMDARNHLGLSYGDICQAATFAKLNLSLDDYKELVFFALLQQFPRLSREEAKEAATREMLKYKEEDFQKFYDDGLAPNVAACGMVLNYL